MNERQKRLRELHRLAYDAMNRRDFESAAKTLKELLELQPDWEHGEGFYNLAHCLEELGRYEEAKEKLERVLDYEPQNPIFLGGLASFLYLHGDPQDAFEKHLALLRLERSLGFRERGKQTAIALRALGRKLGMAPQTVDQLIEEA
jgi:Flp pilus assembly protein TadD